MTSVDPDDVRRFVVDHLGEQLRLQGRSLPQELPDDYDLLLSGTIDSLDLLELLSAVSEQFGDDIDFEALDPDELTVLGPLCRYVAAAAARA